MAHYSFILVCYNNWDDLTKQALESLLESFDSEYRDRGIELIIVNNGSKDKTLEELQNFKTNYKGNVEIVVVNIEENMGYIIGLNAGLSKANGQIVTVLNNDLIFPNGWFRGIAEALDRDSSLGVAVPYLSYACGIQHAGVKLDSMQEIQDFSDKFTTEHQGSILYTNRAISACLTMKRETLNRIGGYDFWFGLGHYDDDDWCLRAIVSGYKIGVIGDSFVYHLGTVTFSQNPESVSASLMSNSKKFMKKWSLKGPGCEEGLYPDRDKAVESTAYDSKKHYLPIKYEDYVWVNQIEDIKRETGKSLLVADWTNFRSEWEKKLEIFLVNHQNSELYLWIPQQYFDEKEVMDKVSKVIKRFKNNNELIDSTLKIKYDNINPDELILLIKLFDNVLIVENDYVNKYIVSLAKQINIPTL